MGFSRPFSDIDDFLREVDGSAGCLADTNCLIAMTDKENAFHDDMDFLFERLAHHKIPIYVSVTARSEFVDFVRRMVMTETLMDMLGPSSPWQISNGVREVLKTHRGWLDNERARDRDLYLNDYRIKDCKQTFQPRSLSGQVGWVKLCQEYLNGKLLQSWDQISESLSLNYIDMRSEGSRSLFRRDLQWNEMYRLSEQSAMGSSDSMILNVLDSSKFTFAITTDYDLAYGTILSSADRTALIPDSLYNRQIKKLRF